MRKERPADGTAEEVVLRPSAQAMADLPYTTACSPQSIAFPGADTDNALSN